MIYGDERDNDLRGFDEFLEWMKRQAREHNQNTYPYKL